MTDLPSDRDTDAETAPCQARVTGEGRLPGDLSSEALIERMIRVDQAGEFGAVRIYQGQLRVLGGTPVGPVINPLTTF